MDKVPKHSTILRRLNADAIELSSDVESAAGSDLDIGRKQPPSNKRNLFTLKLPMPIGTCISRKQYRKNGLVLLALVKVCAVIFLGTVIGSSILERLSASDVSIKNNNFHMLNNNIADANSNCKVCGKLFGMLYQYCSGSTAVLGHIRKLFKAHYRVGVIHGGELHKPSKNMYYEQIKNSYLGENTDIADNDILVESFNMYSKKATLEQKILVFKQDYESVMSTYEKSTLESAYIGILRKNKLDRFLCKIKDCFGREDRIGYMVYAENGTKVTNYACFKRRQEQSNIKLKIHVHVPKLISFMQRQLLEDKKLISNVKKIIYPSEIQYYEDLWAFEYTADDNVFEQSMNAWETLLRNSFIDDDVFDRNIIKNNSLPMKNTRSLSLHKDTIDNFDEVSKALKNAQPPLDHFLRL